MSEIVQSGILESVVPMRYFAAEAARRDGQATDALFLTFNADLAFFESRLLDLCRQAGARVTVVADADVWAPDIRSVTRAGVRYHVGLVATGGAFHPKISLIVGPKRALAVVGSGNLGMAGWQHNAELATVLSADHEAAPRAMVDLQHLLGALGARPEVDPTSADAINRTADRLGELLSNTSEVLDTGHRLVASWNGALIEQLPAQPVDELLLSAAFHDPDSVAVAALLDRLRPRRVRVSMQPGLTVVNPMALDSVLTKYADATGAAVSVVRDPDGSRYRHGKLIEWVAAGNRTALTGSPNLSRMALLRTAPDGNFEVAVLAPIAESLFPGGEEIGRLDEIPVSTVGPPGTDSAPRGPVVTSAVLTGNTLTMRLARLTTDVEAESSRYEDPEAWQPLASIRAGQNLIELASDLRGGDRVQLVWQDDSACERRSSVTFVTDPATAQRRPRDPGHVSRVRDGVPADLWGEDLSFLNSVLAELEALREEFGRGSARVPESEAAVSHPVQRPRERAIEPFLWEQTLDRLGPGIAPYVFGLPPLPPGRRDRAPDWTDPEPPQGASEETEVDQAQQDDEAEESVAVEPVEPDHTQSSLGVRRARRRWCARAAEVAPTLPTQYRLLLLRLTLRLWMLGNWDDEDIEPVQLVARLTRSLAASNIPDDAVTTAELTARVGSLAAVALTFLLNDSDPNITDQRTLNYRELRRHVGHLLPAADHEMMEAYLEGLVSPGLLDLWLYDARELVQDAVEGDPLGEIERDVEIESTTIEVARPQLHLLHLIADVPQQRTERRALELIGRVEDYPGVGIWVSNLHGDWALVAWQPPDLIRVTSLPRGRERWRHQSLRGLVRPQSLALQEFRGENPHQYDQRPPGPRTEAAAAVLATLGLTDPRPPAFMYGRPPTPTADITAAASDTNRLPGSSPSA